jgi:16S rRNA (uracil1498-N3)-methyltransferase
MKEERYFYVPEPQTGILPHDEAVHAIRVLRLKEGDSIHIIDGRGTFYEAAISLATGKHCEYSIISSEAQAPLWQRHIHIAVAPTKMMERMEWFAEKATEIGIDELTFLDCQFSERHQLRTERIEKIVVAAMKQSRKAWMPCINPLTDIKTFLRTQREGKKYICHCYDEIARKDLFTELHAASSAEPVTILIGPEGDFSVDEVQLALSQGYEPVSLGSSRLRTETAALYSVAMTHLSFVPYT